MSPYGLKELLRGKIFATTLEGEPAGARKRNILVFGMLLQGVPGVFMGGMRRARFGGL